MGMTQQSCNRGHIEYLKLLMHNQVGGKYLGGAPIAKHRLRKKQKPKRKGNVGFLYAPEN